ncbi:MAG: Glycosyl transferase family 2 [Candidatus Nitrotoga sp. CP45]|nr:MAG: Glycosyl transferase family 2 [Candidatus Nitrotoga sp. CP45]
MKPQAETPDSPQWAGDSNPRVSVLMAAYNCAAYVGEAIESVLAQTMPDLELILVDDGSTDQSPEIMKHYADQDARVVVYRQENQGIGGATNQALKLARAPYVAILDSDDTMVPERLAIQADYLDQHADIAAVGSQWFTMNTQGDILGIDRQPTDPNNLFTLMFAYFAMHHPTIMARKEIVLACGAYDNKIRRGCMDYGLFFNLLLAGHRMTNLPYLLTRWRLNPSGATHGNAGPQTEDCMSIRAKGFMKMTAQDSNRANQLALALVRTFPAGSWFDERVSHLLSDPAPSPALLRWRELAARGLVSDLEAACVNWLCNEQDYAEQLADLLRRDGFFWLGQLVLGKAGRVVVAPDKIVNPVPTTATSPGLALLIPTQAGDHELIDRFRASLDGLPENAEIIVFSTDGTAANVPASLLHPRLRVLPTAAVITQAWHQALSETRCEFIACVAAGCRHHPEFLAQSLAALQSDANLSLVYAPSDVYYPDALDCNGNAVKDPSPEPLWTRQTLLGRDRGNLSCMVFRRKLICALPLAIEEIVPATSWAIARSLLGCTEPLVLPLRNIEFAPKVGLANNIMDALIRRLVTWYLDTGLGSIPTSWVWPQLSATQGLQRVRELDARLLENKLCIHPGNASLIAEFVACFSRMALFRPVFKYLLVHYPATAIGVLRKRNALVASLCGPWRLLLRGYTKFRKAIRLYT